MANIDVNKNIKILFVDDSSVIRDMVESSLLQLGYMDIESAEDGVEALELASQEEYDFIITDINMPNMDGIELIRILRDKLTYASIPIMVLTTEWSESMKQKGKEVGATSWIVKPFDTELLDKAMIETIQKARE
jgi:two-component system chemotaxis response regulator CheY